MNVTAKLIATTAIASALAAGLAYAQTGENNTPMRGSNETNMPRDTTTTTGEFDRTGLSIAPKYSAA